MTDIRDELTSLILEYDALLEYLPDGELRDQVTQRRAELADHLLTTVLPEIDALQQAFDGGHR
ncbi:MAG TPA: hypothetical protein VME67_09735 [Mycobacterium sp.]|nr:hypothetical protein [Mycobacterium sp.]HTX95090.1 hypothetical protein [Mycobacterium sp.]